MFVFALPTFFGVQDNSLWELFSADSERLTIQLVISTKSALPNLNVMTDDNYKGRNC